MFKKVLWTLPVLAVGIAIGSFAFPNVFASTNTGYGWMHQAMHSSQGQAMFQTCNNYMSQSAQSQK